MMGNKKITLILHGFHCGYIDAMYTIRGRRVFCNNRRSRNKGCGHTCTIFLSNTLHTCTMCAERARVPGFLL